MAVMNVRDSLKKFCKEQIVHCNRVNLFLDRSPLMGDHSTALIKKIENMKGVINMNFLGLTILMVCIFSCFIISSPSRI